MGLLTFSISVTLDGCVDHTEGIADDETHAFFMYDFLVHPRIAGHGPTLYQGGLPSTRRLELVSAKPLRNGAVAMRYQRATS
jgi:hypothetical protein